MIHHTLLICRNGVIERDDLRLSNMRIERQDDSQHGTDNSAEALLARAFKSSSRSRPAPCMKKSRMPCYALLIVSAITTKCTPPTCWA